MAFTIGTEFDRATQWGARLGQELPFLRAWLRSWNAVRVADLACGTGRHAVALADCGFVMTGLDMNEDMLAEAAALELTRVGQRNSADPDGLPSAGHCDFIQGDMRIPLALPPQDALLCLGNSLCLLDSLDEVRQTLAAFAKVLAPRGGVILHVLNYPKFADPQRAFFPLKTDMADGLPVRHYLKMIELRGERALVHLVTLEEDSPGHWLRRVRTDRLLVLEASLLQRLLLETGFAEVQVYGSLKGEWFQRQLSHDVVLCARKK